MTVPSMLIKCATSGESRKFPAVAHCLSCMRATREEYWSLFFPPSPLGPHKRGFRPPFAYCLSNRVLSGIGLLIMRRIYS